MARAVVILGAGASADFGVPTLRRIFKDRYAQQYLYLNPGLRHQIGKVFWTPRGYDLSTSEQSLTIEEMLTILRDWEQEEGCPKPKEDFHDFRRQLYVLVYKAVFEGKSSKGKHLNPLIHKCGLGFDQTTWASFNWDCIFEASFYYQSGDAMVVGSRHNPHLVIDLEGWRRGRGSHEYMKVHGSINWWLVNGRPTYLSFGSGGALIAKWEDYAKRMCGDDFPLILEPSAHKYHDVPYTFLEPQWREFFARLCEADCVIVVGYSLPDADTQARSKILTAFQSNPKSKWLLIDPANEVCDRYRRLLGQRRLRIIQTTLTGLNNDLETSLHTAFPQMDFSEPAPIPPAGP